MEDNNPFSDYGTIVTHERFIGRAIEVLHLEQRVLSQYGGGCIAIVGESRIGKTSLMRYVFHPQNPSVQQANGVTVDINVSLWRKYTSVQFFHTLSREIYRQAGIQHKDKRQQIKELYEDVKDFALDDVNLLLTEFLRGLSKLGLRLIILMDEFDSIEHIFENESAPYLLLRELGASADYGTVFVTTSRLDISSIEVQDRKISSLAGIFSFEYLSLMSDKDFRDLFTTRLKYSDTHFTRRDIEFIKILVNNHPYFSQVVGFHLWNLKHAKGRYNTISDSDQIRIENLVKPEIYATLKKYANRMTPDQQELIKLVVCENSQKHVSTELDYFVQRGILVHEDGRYKPFGMMYEKYLCANHDTLNETDGINSEVDVRRQYTACVLVYKTEDQRYRFLITNRGKSSYWELPKVPHEETETIDEILDRLLAKSTSGVFSFEDIVHYEQIDVQTYTHETIHYYMCIMDIMGENKQNTDAFQMIDLQSATDKLHYATDKDMLNDAFERYMVNFGNG